MRWSSYNVVRHDIIINGYAILINGYKVLTTFRDVGGGGGGGGDGGKVPHTFASVIPSPTQPNQPLAPTHTSPTQLIHWLLPRLPPPSPPPSHPPIFPHSHSLCSRARVPGKEAGPAP